MLVDQYRTHNHFDIVLLYRAPYVDRNNSFCTNSLIRNRFTLRNLFYRYFEPILSSFENFRKYSFLQFSFDTRTSCLMSYIELSNMLWVGWWFSCVFLKYFISKIFTKNPPTWTASIFSEILLSFGSIVLLITSDPNSANPTIDPYICGNAASWFSSGFDSDLTIRYWSIVVVVVKFRLISDRTRDA